MNISNTTVCAVHLVELKNENQEFLMIGINLN